jgi:hypothetical protein
MAEKPDPSRIPKRAVELLRDGEPKQIVDHRDRVSIVFETTDGRESIAFHGVDHTTVQPVREVADGA